ncbi:hypothetical protein G6F35_018730 [Rhizopus arrhizus]|nr:hypothetical protein G6F35_018730 [Rhizopus arrhizus]
MAAAPRCREQAKKKAVMAAQCGAGMTARRYGQSEGVKTSRQAGRGESVHGRGRVVGRGLVRRKQGGAVDRVELVGLAAEVARHVQIGSAHV